MSSVAYPTHLCPLCGQPNRCANEVERETGVKQDHCWCTEASFSPDLLARVPPEAQRLVCICPSCAAGGKAA